MFFSECQSALKIYNDIPSCQQLQNNCLNNQHSVVTAAQRLSLLKKFFKPSASVTNLFKNPISRGSFIFGNNEILKTPTNEMKCSYCTVKVHTIVHN